MRANRKDGKMEKEKIEKRKEKAKTLAFLFQNFFSCQEKAKELNKPVLWINYADLEERDIMWVVYIMPDGTIKKEKEYW